MATKILTMEKIEEESPEEKAFTARQSTTSKERKMFLEDFDKFEKLMKTPPVQWETRLVHKRNLRTKEKELMWEECEPKDVGSRSTKANSKVTVSMLIKAKENAAAWSQAKDRCDISKELEERLTNLVKLKKSEEAADKKKYTKESRKEIKLSKIGDDGKKIPLLKEIPLPKKGNPTWISAAGDIIPYVSPKTGLEFFPNLDGTFSCIEQAHSKPQFRIMGPLAFVKKSVDYIIKTANQMGLEIPEDSEGIKKIGLVKLVIDKKDRLSGAFCSDTIRAYMSPVGAEEEEESEFTD